MEPSSASSSGRGRTNSRACCKEEVLWGKGVKGQGCGELGKGRGTLARPQAASGVTKDLWLAADQTGGCSHSLPGPWLWCLWAWNTGDHRPLHALWPLWSGWATSMAEGTCPHLWPG